MLHRRNPCTILAIAPSLAALTLGALALSACTSSHSAPATSLPATTQVRAEPPVPPVDKHLVEAALAQWRSLTDGRTATYTASSECIVCATPGRWNVVERNGVLISAIPLDGQDPALATQVPTVTDALLAAVEARGQASASVSATHVFVTYDGDPQVSDDEGDITAENIVIS